MNHRDDVRQLLIRRVLRELILLVTSMALLWKATLMHLCCLSPGSASVNYLYSCDILYLQHTLLILGATSCEGFNLVGIFKFGCKVRTVFEV